MSKLERAIILIKAWPQPSKRYGETVCCAGVTPEGEWRRLFPIRFRHLSGDSKFTRWDIVEYRPELPRDDSRRESRRVAEETLKVVGSMPVHRRAGFFERLLRDSYRIAAARGESLALVRPRSLEFRWRKKSSSEMIAEEQRRAEAMAQSSLFDSDLRQLEICPFNLRLVFEDAEGGHGMMCGDWETPATFFKWRTRYGEQGALTRLKEAYEGYLASGVALALGTVKKRPKQWTLLGIIRLDETPQPTFDF